MLPLHVVTLALNAHPLLLIQFSNLNRYDGNWMWHIVHGTAANTGSTAWCQRLPPGLSSDGTTELLATWRGHPHIRIYERALWTGGKDEMFATALTQIRQPCVLLQADADEFFEPDQLSRLVDFMTCTPDFLCARFFCRFFVGPNIVITSEHGYGNRPSEWLRAWNFEPHMTFESHEPPKFVGLSAPCATREHTRDEGLVFQHWAYMFEEQVAFKERFYGYTDAVRHWKRLQSNHKWPIKDLREFLPWVERGVSADLLWNLRSTSRSDVSETSSPRSQLLSTRLPRAGAPA